MGFFVPVFVALFFGADRSTDAFFFAYSLVVIGTVVFAKAPELALLPFIAERAWDPDETRAFLNRWASVATVTATAVWMAASFLLAPFLEASTHLDAGTIRETVGLFRIGFAAVLFSVGSSTVSAYLNFRKDFGPTAALAVLRPATAVLAVFFFGRRFGLAALMCGYVAGEVFTLACLTARAQARWGYAVAPAFRRHPGVRLFAVTAFFQVASTSTTSLIPVVEQAFASRFGEGGVTLLNYGTLVFSGVTAAVITGFATVLGSYWANDYQGSRNRSSLRGSAAAAARKSFLFTIPFCALFYLIRQPLANVLAPHVKFPLEAPVHLAGLYLWALVPVAPAAILIRYFLIEKRTATLCFISLVQLVICAAANRFYAGGAGLEGIAWAALTHYAVAAALIVAAFAAGRGGRR